MLFSTNPFYFCFLFFYFQVSDNFIDNSVFGHRNHNKNVDIKFSAHNVFLE